MDIQRLLSDHNIPFALPGDHHHASPGWVNVHCPFCGGQSFHLGISVDHGNCHCWRCGGHSLADTLCQTLHISLGQAFGIIEKYKGTSARKQQTRTEPKVSIHPLRFPRPFSPLTNSGISYLSKRKFDPEQLAHDWELRQTGPAAYLDGISYGQRIIIPIHWKNEMVSFQARDITGRSELRYLACPKPRERIHHKHIVYGKQERWGDYPALIIVEGPTDVWRLGFCAVAVFGIEFTIQQVLTLAKAHNQFVLLFDPEPLAQRQATKLATKLLALGRRVRIEKLETDPGDLSQTDAKCLVKNLMGGRIK